MVWYSERMGDVVGPRSRSPLPNSKLKDGHAKCSLTSSITSSTFAGTIGDLLLNRVVPCECELCEDRDCAQYMMKVMPRLLL